MAVSQSRDLGSARRFALSRYYVASFPRTDERNIVIYRVIIQRLDGRRCDLHTSRYPTGGGGAIFAKQVSIILCANMPGGGVSKLHESPDSFSVLLCWS